MFNITKIRKIKFTFLIILLIAFCANVKAQNNTDELKKKIMEAYEFFNTHEVTKEKASKFIDDNYIDHTPDPGLKGNFDDFIESFANLKKAFPDYKITVNELSIGSDGMNATVLITITGTNTGEMMGMPATGKSVNFSGIDYLKFKDKKCIERWGYFDQMAMMQQLGLMK